MTAAQNHRDIPSPNGSQNDELSLVPPVSFTALTPLAFLGRAAQVFADKTAIVYGERELSYSEFAAEATRLAHALRPAGVRRDIADESTDRERYQDRGEEHRGDVT